MEKLLHQLASKQTIVVNVYDTTNASAPINMYGPDVTDTGLLRVSNLDFGDPSRKHKMHCRLVLSQTSVYKSAEGNVITYLFRRKFSFIYLFIFVLITGLNKNLLYLGRQSMHQ